MPKYLRNRADGYIFPFHADAAENPLFEVVEVERGTNPQPEHFLSESDLEAKAAKAAKPPKAEK